MQLEGAAGGCALALALPLPLPLPVPPLQAECVVACPLPAQAHAPRDYISSGQAYLQLAASSLVELPSRLNFCKQRMSQAEKLAKLVGAGAGAGGAAGKKEEAEKLLSDYMRGAEELFRGCMAVVSDMNQRYDAISRSAGGGSEAAEGLRAVDALNRQVHEAYDSVQASYRAPLAEAPPPAPRERHQSGNRGGAAAAAAALTNGAATAAAGHAAIPTSKAPAAASSSSGRPVSVPSAVLVAAFPAAAAAHAATQLQVEPVAVPAVVVAAAPRPAGPPPKQWGRVQAATPAEVTPEGEDAPAPTPAEAAAARAAEAAAMGGVDGGFKEVAVKKNKRTKA